MAWLQHRLGLLRFGGLHRTQRLALAVECGFLRVVDGSPFLRGRAMLIGD
jgi:hypothetical protein